MAYELQPAAERHTTDPTPANRQAVAVAAYPLVRSMARRITLPDHPLATHEDLVNAGMLGMLQALDNYNTERGTSFASFAYARIRGSFIDYLRMIDMLSRDRRRRVAEVQLAASQLQQELGTEPRALQVADHLGMSIEDYHGLMSDAQRRFTMSLHDEQDNDRGRGASPLDTLAHPTPIEEHERFERLSLYEHVARLIEQFPEREQRIVALYYFEDLTLREIAAQLNLTEARISQILSKTLRTLRGHLVETRTAA